MIDSLCVVHLQEYSKVPEQRCPVKQFVSKVKPFSASTCSRHVYLFTASQAGDYPTQELTKINARTAQYLTGGNAYFFVLCWLVGVESHKLNHNDHFVLGKVREVWTHFSENKAAKAAPYKSIMDLLFQDAGAIRKIIQAEQEAKNLPTDEEYVQWVKRMCANCTQAREQKMNPDYDSLHMKEENYLSHLQKYRLKLISNKLIQFQQKAPACGLLLPRKKSEQSHGLKQFELALRLTRQKYQPELFAEKPKSSNDSTLEEAVGCLRLR